MVRLADFILANTEPILAEWEAYARDIWLGGAEVDVATLRDHAEHILRATARDMQSDQTDAQQSDKSKGHGHDSASSDRLEDVSDKHGVGRVESGFELTLVIAEYRALRAGVIRLWRKSRPAPDLHDLDDLTRFNESIDQSLTGAVRAYTHRVDRSRRTFLGILGHDLRTPLAAVQMAIAGLLRQGRLDAQSAETLSLVGSTAKGMGNLIRDLLDFTATELGGRMPVSPAPADLGQVCREVVGEVRVAHPDCAIDLQTRGDLTGEWDADRLRQAVANLVVNAVQHSGNTCGAEVAIAADGPDAVTLTVHNGGPPIPPEVLPTIFEPLVRGVSRESELRRRPGSMGLGLYIARSIVTAHGGTIDVTSSTAAGTTFTLRLPRHPPGRAS
jgi:signal transduction histidine kinase